MNQTRVMNDVTSSAISDFEINGKVFEKGGRKKRRKQIEGADEGYIVKDDIESGYTNVILLWALGLDYLLRSAENFSYAFMLKAI